MKTINFELSKKLNDLGLLDNIKTEYYLMENIFGDYVLGEEINMGTFNPNGKKYKTLTLEESIEFLPNKVKGFRLCMNKNEIWYTDFDTKEQINFIGETLLEAIEAMILFLLNNGLLKIGN